MQKRAATLAAAAVIALVASGCGSSSDGGGGEGGDGMTAQSPATTESAAPPASGSGSGGAAVQSATVDIKSFKYKPVTVTVKKGGRVRWTNSDAAAHTSTADDRSFDTQTLDKGKSKSVTMT